MELLQHAGHPAPVRYSLASLLLIAGAPTTYVVAVQPLLDQKHVDTALRYKRLHDSTVAADYERAMGKIESTAT